MEDVEQVEAQSLDIGKNSKEKITTGHPKQGTGWKILANNAVGLALLLAIIIFSLLKPRIFPTYENFISLLGSQAIQIVLTLGLLFPLAAGEFDLSIGYTLGFSAMLAAVLIGQDHWSLYAGFLAAIAAGFVIGIANATLVLGFKLNAFIATLASGTILEGLTLWISGSQIVAGLPPSVTNIGTGTIARVPYLVFVALVFVIIVLYVLELTPLGRYFHATGAGRASARLAGIRTGRLLFVSFVISGLMAGVSGVMETATLGAANPDVGGQFLLPSFAAAFLGATTIRPGRFNVLGMILAIFLLAVGIDGLTQLGAPLWVSSVFNGGALIVAVGVAVRRQRTGRVGS